MKKFRLIISLIIVLLAATFVSAQADKSHSVSENKIAVVNTDAFKDEKTGIDDLIEVYKKLEEEFRTQTEELRIMNDNLQKLFNEFKEANDRCDKAIHCSDKTAEEVSRKLKDYELFNEKFKRRQEKVKSLFEKRKAELTADINRKIVEAILQFQKKKGYALILDASLKDSLACQPSDGFVDVTEEFIKFYNESFGKAKRQ
jgi:Skp family chaperone for outer membrane proteins